MIITQSFLEAEFNERSLLIYDELKQNKTLSPYWTSEGETICEMIQTEFKAIAALQNWTSARISEISDIRFSDLVKKETLEIVAKKGSWDRQSDLPNWTNQTKQKCLSFHKLILDNNYQSYNRAITKVITDNNLTTYPNSKNSTHIFRHYFAHQNKDLVESIIELQVLFGHHNLESTFAYLK